MVVYVLLFPPSCRRTPDGPSIYLVPPRLPRFLPHVCLPYACMYMYIYIYTGFSVILAGVVRVHVHLCRGREEAGEGVCTCTRLLVCILLVHVWSRHMRRRGHVHFRVEVTVSVHFSVPSSCFFYRFPIQCSCPCSAFECVSAVPRESR